MRDTYHNPASLVFCTEDGRPYDPKSFEEEYKKVLRYANVREMNLHATRHTFATEAMQMTNDIVTVADVLGHAKPSTTLDMYGHTFDDRRRALMAQFKQKWTKASIPVRERYGDYFCCLTRIEKTP